MKNPYLLRQGENMRQLFFVGTFFISLLFAGTISAQQTSSSVAGTKVNFETDPFTPYFVENKGQFDQYDAEKGKNDFISPSYGSQMGNAILLFNGSSVQFVENIIKNKENERGGKDKDKDPAAEREFETWRQTMNFVNGNPDAKFVTEESQASYFTYPDPAVQNGTITANAFGKLIEKDVYPGIDVEFSFKPEGGIKYSFIVNPGADASLIQIKWSGVDDITLNGDGDLQIKCENGTMTDKDPVSYYQGERIEIPSEFVVNKKTISFHVGKYDHNKTLVIDPWVFSPALMGNNRGYDIQHDPSGNVYVYGGSNPYQLKKFTSAGALIWTYNTAATGYYGDFVIDGAGNAFCVYGPWGDQCVKITPAGAMVWSVSQSSSREVYRVFPNPANAGQLTIMGMGMPAGLTPMVLNINMTTGAYSGPWYHPTCTAGETRGMAVDVNGDAYGLVFSTGNANAANNLLWKVNAANTTVASVQDGYLLWESQASNTDSQFSGYNGVAVGCFVYTYDGVTVKKWDKTTLALLGSAVVPGGVSYVTAGICIDVCGNVYVGGPNSILEYDPNLGFLTSVATSGQVYDVNLGSAPGEILACGNQFFGSYTFPVCSSAGISATAVPATCSACNGSATVTMNPAGAYTYSWSPSGGTGATATGLCAGTYTVTATLGCQTYTTSIVVPSGGGGLTVASAQNNVTCAGACNATASLTITGGTGPYTFAWSPAATNSTAANVNTGTGLCAGSYTVTSTDAGGCTSTNTITITQPPALTNTPSQANPLCNGGTGTAINNPAGGTGAYTYNWSPSGGSAATSSPITAGTYTCTITDANGCTLTQSFALIDPPLLTATSTSVPATCGSPNGSATVSPSGGTGAYTYSWAPSGGNAATASGLLAATYTCTISDANGCSITESVVVTSVGGLNVSIPTFSNISCFGGSNGSATAFASGGAGGYTYSWSPSGGTGITASSLTANSYTVTVTDSGGCTAQASVTLTEPPALTTAASHVDELCNGSSNASAMVTPSGGAGGYTYSWSPSGGNGSIASSLAAASYTCTITDVNGCSITQSFTITEPTAIVVTLSETDSNCGQADGTASSSAVGGTGAYTYNWMPGNYTTQNITNVVAGTYTCTVTDVNACTGTATVTINNINGVTASIVSSTDILCNGQSTGAITVTQVGGNPNYTYSWSPNVSTSTNATNIAAGTYSITVTDANGCASTTTVTLTEPPALTINSTAAPAVMCSGTPVTLSSTPAGGTPAYSVLWTPINMSGNSQTFTPAASGTYTATVTDVNGCTASSTTSITVNPIPVPALVGDVLSGCAPVCTNFTDQSTVANPGVITSWSWDFGDNATSNVAGPNHCYNSPGVYTVSLSISTSDGCAATVTMPNYISVFANPVAAFGASPQPATMIDPTITFTDSSQNATAWNWSFGDINNSTSTLENPTFTYLAPDCYDVVLSVSTPQGCVDTTDHIVCIGPEVTIFVPNAFTPNGNGTNDVFNCVQMGIDPDHFEMWIFDRWGNMIFYTTDLNKGWDGTYQNKSGELCQIDTYVWKIKARDVEGNSHNMIGKVSLIR